MDIRGFTFFSISLWLQFSLASVMVPGQTGLSTICPNGMEIYVGTGPGSPFDIFARELAKEITALNNISCVVMNRQGASGSMGAQAAIDSKKNCVAFVSSDSILFIEDVYQLRFSPKTDFVPLLKVASFPMFMAVSIESGIKSMKDFEQQARSGRLMFASPGIASRPHLVAEQLAENFRFEYTHVPSRGGAELNGMLARNEVQFVIASQNLQPLLQSNPPKALIIATSSEKHVSPQIVKFDFDVEPWVGLYAPSRTPMEFQSELTQMILKIIAKEPMKTFLENQGYEISPIYGAEFKAKVLQDSEQLKYLIRKRKIKVE